jgi:predicted aldo/keto reductase-like oxidoreductase
METRKLNRRDFLTKSSIGIVGIGSGLINNTAINKNSCLNRIQEQTRIKEYRTLGRTGFKVSDIGCGTISISNENVLKSILLTGVNFIDTADAYSNGNNEKMIGRAIKDLNRSSIFINTKISISESDDKDSIVLRARRCLERLDTDYLDGLMLWNVKSVNETQNKAFHQAIKQLKSEGRVKFCGVSCHGSNYVDEPKETMEQIIGTAVESGRFDLVMFVYNYVQQKMGENILKACTKKNIGTTLMKTDPFGGYFLNIVELVKNYKRDNKTIPENQQKVYDKILKKQAEAEPFLQKYGYLNNDTFREAAIGFGLNNKSVNSVLITFRNFNDVNDYINLSGSRLTEQNVSMINFLRNSFGNLYCRHACGQCENLCPYEVPINTIMRYNHYFMAQSREKYSIKKYLELSGVKANKCSSCEGFCEQACPHEVSIKALLTIAHQNLSLQS